MVFEAHSGGWSPTTKDVLTSIARAQHARGVWRPEGQLNKIAERLSCTLMKYAAHAILRRERPLDLRPSVPLNISPNQGYEGESDDEEMDPGEEVDGQGDATMGAPARE